MTGRRRWSASWVALALVVCALALVQGGEAHATQRGESHSNPLYDLKIKYGKSTIVAGGTLRVKVTVHNLRSKPLSPHKLLVQLVGDKPSLAHVKTPTIPAKSTKTVVVKVTIPVATRAGERTLRACGAMKHSTEKCGSIRADGQLTVLAPARVTVSPASFVFGATGTGTQSSLKTFTLKNNGGVPTTAISARLAGADAGQFATSDDTCSGHPLGAGATCTVNVTFNPTSVGTKTATLTVTGTPGGSATASLSGIGANPAVMTFSPLQHAFGGIATGTTSTQLFTVTNSGGVPTGTLTTSLTGTDADQFGTADDDCDGHTLAVGASCSVTVSFAPTTTGGKSASLQVSGTPGGSPTAQLSGTGLNPAALSMSPTQHAFGVRATGTVGDAKTFTVTNTGDLPTGALTTGLVNGDKDQFQTSDDTCNGQTLAAAASCSVTVSFAPTTTGVKTATLFASATPGGSATATLSGTGATPATLVISPIMQPFGSVALGSSDSRTFTVTNTGGVTTGALATALSGTDAAHFSLSGNTCSGRTLAAAATCTVTVTFAPTTTGARSASVQISATPGGLATAALSGTGANPATLAISPLENDFGSVGTGASSPNTFMVTNTGGVSSGTLTVSITGEEADQFSETDDTCSAQSLTAGATCTVTVSFAPTTTGAKSASLVVSATPGGTATAALSGTGANPATLAISPPQHDFGDVGVGSSSPHTFTVANTGGVSSGTLTVSLSGGQADQFSVAADECTSTLAPGATCKVTVSFAPTSAGAKNATLEVSATPGGTAIVSLSGAGG